MSQDNNRSRTPHGHCNCRGGNHFGSFIDVNGISVGITQREEEIMRLLQHKAMSTEAIADSLSISPATVRNHIQAIMNALGVHSRLEAVVFLYQQEKKDEEARRMELEGRLAIAQAELEVYRSEEDARVGQCTH